MSENRSAEEQLRQERVRVLKEKALSDLGNLRDGLGKNNDTEETSAENKDPLKGAAENLDFIYTHIMPTVKDYLSEIGSIGLIGKNPMLDGGIYVRSDGLHIVPNTEELRSWKLPPDSLSRMYNDQATKNTMEKLGKMSKGKIAEIFQSKVENPEGSFAKPL